MVISQLCFQYFRFDDDYLGKYFINNQDQAQDGDKIEPYQPVLLYCFYLFQYFTVFCRFYSNILDSTIFKGHIGTKCFKAFRCIFKTSVVW